MRNTFRKGSFIAILFSAFALSAFGGDFKIPRLSPLPTNVEEWKVPLNGEWRFTSCLDAELPDPDKFESVIQVPGEWTMQGFEVEKGERAGYARNFDIPTLWEGKRIKLRCNAIYSECDLFVNGEKAGSHLGGFTAFEMDVTKLVVPGKRNEIMVSVASESLADSASSGSRYAVHPLGGITRDIYLFALPESNISLFHASTSFDTDYKDATLKAEVCISNESPSRIDNLSVEFVLRDKQGNRIPLSSTVFKIGSLPSGESRDLNVSFDVAEPEKWDCEHPNLYMFGCRLRNGEEVVEETVRRIGFRQIEVRGNEVFVNGMPIKLRGVCRHEVMPLRGRSLCGDIWREDVEMFRRGNVNYIRTSHYPPDEALLEACDELGMFVEVEAPFCWAHETDIPESKFYEVLVNQHVEMVNRDRSHPSILMWSIGNESKKFNEYFRRASETVRAIDPTRPRIFSQWNPKGDEGALEIANHHYPGMSGPEKYRNHPRPVVFDEYCHVNAYNRFELSADPGLRNAWGALLDKMWNGMYHSKGVLGGAIWVGIDDTFFLPGGKAVGYGTWGVVDGWRREKPEFWNMKKAYSPVKIALLEGENAKTRLRIENRYIFSNLSECRIEWKYGKKSGTIRADIPPRSADTIEIDLKGRKRTARNLELSVTGVQGFEVDRYCFSLRPETERTKPDASHGSVKLGFKELPEAYVIEFGRRKAEISKADGLISVSEKKRKLITGAPALMPLPLNKEGDGVQMTGKSQTFEPYNPVCTEWVKDSIACSVSDSVVKIRVCGRYKEASGCYVYSIRGDGKMTVDYDFVLSEDVSPRQTGLMFSVPSNFTALKWRRKGYWSVYPEGHISALQGKAQAFRKELPVSGLAGPSSRPTVGWELDQTANGSNIFRSTKENIIEAALESEDGTRIRVLSDGSQHFRAWADKGSVRFLAADYSNAGSEKFLKEAKPGHKQLKAGDRVKGSVRIGF